MSTINKKGKKVEMDKWKNVEDIIKMEEIIGDEDKAHQMIINPPLTKQEIEAEK